jgi:hypothetical protein
MAEECHGSSSMRKLKATCTTNFNYENAKALFKNSKNQKSGHKFSANKIYNLDKTDKSTVCVLPKIIFAKGLTQVGSVISGNRTCYDCCCKYH